MIAPINDAALYQCFVQPDLCRELCLLGLTEKTIHSWKVRGAELVLHTHVFDIDNYYRDGIRQIDSVCPPDFIIPAFTIKDIEKCLPCNFTLQVQNGIYYLYAGLNLPVFEAERLPDVFAKCLKMMVINGYVRSHDINNIIACAV